MRTAGVSILDACQNPKLFAHWFRDPETWTAWRVFLAVLFGLSLDRDGRAIFGECTDRYRPKPNGYLEAWLVCGRRSGKSFVLALVAVFLACFKDWSPYLAPGERGTIMVIATDKKQARTIFRYIHALVSRVSALAPLIDSERSDGIDLTNNITIEIVAAGFRGTRGYTLIAALCDELAFWQVDDYAANPDSEILNALRPAMATVPGAMLLCASSPYAKRGELYRAFRQHYGNNESPVLIWKAPTLRMNPTISKALIDDAYERDPQWAAAEFGGEFRSDIESFVSREVVEAATATGRHEVAPAGGVRYAAFADPSGGSSDAMTLAIAHRDPATNRVVLDAVRERRPPFSPQEVVAEFAELLRSYSLSTVQGDHYAGEWPRERFREAGIQYEPAAKPKSELYLNLLPMLNSGQVELLDHPRLQAQLVGLERRTARGGRDSIDHAPGAHDDLVNAVAGAVATFGRSTAAGWVAHFRDLAEQAHHRPSDPRPKPPRITADQFGRPKAAKTPVPVTLRAPRPYMNFMFGAGRRFASDADALIHGVEPHEVEVLMKSGCVRC